MVAVTAVALPAAWSYDRRSDDGEELALAPTSTLPAVTASTAAPTTVEIPRITIAPVPTSVPPSRALEVEDLSGLPEIRSAADLAPADDVPLDELPDITAPRAESSDGDGEGEGESEDGSATGSETTVASVSVDDATDPVANGETALQPEPLSVEEPGASDDVEVVDVPSPPADPAPAPEEVVTADTSPTPPPRRDPSSYSVEDIKQLIRATWPADQVEMALKVAQRESSYNPRDENFCCLGIFQIYYEVNQSYVHRFGYTREDLFDPAANIRVAFALWQDRGWAPWRQTAY